MKQLFSASGESLPLAWQIGLVGGVAALVQLRLRGAQRVRALWQSAVVASLVLIVLSTCGFAKGLLGELVGRSKSTSRQWEVRLTEDQLAALPSASDGVVKPSAVSGERDPYRWVVWIWGAGFLLLGGRAILARVHLGWRLRRGRRVTSLDIIHDVQALGGKMGLRRQVRLLELDGLVSPIAFGSLRPTICLPTNFESHYTENERAAVLAHELAHLASGDPHWQGAVDVLTMLLWWHPMIWWMRRSLRVANEMAADEAAVLVEQGAIALAECLVRLGRNLPTRERWSVGFGANGFRSGLGQRVQRLLRAQERAWIRPVGLRRFSGLACVSVLFSAAALTATAWSGVFPETNFAQAWRQSLAGRVYTSLSATADEKAVAAAEPSTAEATRESNELQLRVYKVDLVALGKALEQRTTGQVTDETKSKSEVDPNRLLTALTSFLRAAGIRIESPKELALGARESQVILQASPEDHDMFSRALQILLPGPVPQLTIEVKLCEAPTEQAAQLENEIRNRALSVQTNSVGATWKSVLTEPSAKIVFQALEQIAGADVLATPRVTTLSGRQAQIKIAEVKTLVTEVKVTEAGKKEPVPHAVELGPVVDIVPVVDADGITIRSTVMITVREFVGYAEEGESSGLAQVRVRQLLASTEAQDGQTVILGGGTDEVMPKGNAPKASEKRLLIFVTSTLIDAAGNRINTGRGR